MFYMSRFGFGLSIIIFHPLQILTMAKRPYQCLFMAACAHVWHYKCISRLIHSPDYPMFQCPNCRAFTDLSAEVDDTNDFEGDGEKDTKEPAVAESTQEDPPQTQESTNGPTANSAGETQDQQENHHSDEPSLVDDVENLHIDDEQQAGAASEDTRSSDSPAPNTSQDDLARSATNIPGWQPTQPLSVPSSHQSHLRTDTPVRSETSDENPLTPRNDSGPLAFDGRAGMP